MVTIKFKVGRGQIEFSGNSSKDIHKFGSIYGALPRKCDACNSDDIYLSHKSPKGNDYYMIACYDCGAELNLHQKKEGGFYIVSGEKMKKYEGGNNEPTKKDMEKSNGVGPSNDEIPF